MRPWLLTTLTGSKNESKRAAVQPCAVLFEARFKNGDFLKGSFKSAKWRCCCFGASAHRINTMASPPPIPHGLRLWQAVKLSVRGMSGLVIH